MSGICSFLVIFSVIYNVHASVAACSESTALTSAQIQVALDAHNLHRSQAGDVADMKKLVWSDQIAAKAQDYANRCTPGVNFNTQCYSESNPTGGMIRNSAPKVNSLTFNATDISTKVQLWARWKMFYNSTTGGCRDFFSTHNGHEYKRLMWAEASEIGCGLSSCDQPSDLFYVPTWSFVCYYSPGGNFRGTQKPYQQGTPCSKCNQTYSGSWGCENNLCVAL